MKLTMAAIVAVSVLMMPTEGAAQSNPPDTIDEAWSCSGEIMLRSTCTPSGRCSGSFKLGNYPAQDAAFEIHGIERRWYWQPNGDGGYTYGFAITPGRDLDTYTDYSTIIPRHSTHRCRKTQ